MTSRQINHLLTGATILIGLAALVIVATGVFLPIDVRTSDPAARRGATIEAVAGPTTQSAGLERMFARSFRNALDDSPIAALKATAASAALATAPLVQVNVIGTVGISVAILRLADGNVVARSVGDQIDGAEIVRIDATSVRFRRNGQDFSIVKPPAADASGGLIVIR